MSAFAIQLYIQRWHPIFYIKAGMCLSSQNTSRRIKRVLVANRGEIAIRVMRTAKRMGIQTIAVYSDADVNSLHNKFADLSYCIGEPSPLKSYLCAQKIVDVANHSKADAIHPGYGFLSENAEFTELCTKNGLIFIGPPATAIRDMGMKNKAKQIMINAGVPVIVGYNGMDQTEENLFKHAKNLGFPVMIKAVCGGGGKGMRIVWLEKDFFECLNSARSEAQKAFGNTDMILEKYVQRPRHVEVQIFGDQYGNYVYLWERDCSIQRRHQKIIEEAPAPGLDRETRHWLGKTAVEAAKAVNYVGAGTVEFIFDTSERKFYFMEMNTRLQVEHPITEAITNQDLVEWQFRVAQGEQLPLNQEQILLRGHAIEARIYAEDSTAGFIPTPGILEHLEFPEDARIDSGVRESDEVTVYYDPMIAKIVVAGDDREHAIRLLDSALDRTHIGGDICTNVQFVQNCLKHDKFKNADLYTNFITDHQEELLATEKKMSEEALIEGTISEILLKSFHALNPNSNVANPFFSQPTFFRLNHFARITVYLSEHQMEVIIMRDGKYKINDQEVLISGIECSLTPQSQKPVVKFSIEASDGKKWKCKAVELTGAIMVFGMERHKWIKVGDDSALNIEEFLEVTDDANARSPMPGVIEKLFVKENDQVAKGQPLVSLNAMKMEFIIRAPFDCSVLSLNCALGQNVPKEAVLVQLKKEEK